jgi:hypothetical protein
MPAGGLNPVCGVWLGAAGRFYKAVPASNVGGSRPQPLPASTVFLVVHILAFLDISPIFVQDKRWR